MKALVYLGIENMVLQEMSVPDDPFLIRVGGAGICGTDLKTFQKGHHMFIPPAILGHEFYGMVERAPRESEFKPGEWVVVAPYVECGNCELCMRGVPSLCKNKSFVNQGAFCQYVGIPLDYLSKGVFRIPGPDDVYTLVEPLACVLNGIARLGIGHASRVLIVGGGPMGALFALVFKEKQIQATVVEPVPFRRETMRSWGVEAIEAIGMGKTENQYDAVVIAVNKKELVSEYIARVADGGTLLVFSGMSRKETLLIDAYSVHYREVTITGSFGYAISHFKEALAMIQEYGSEFSQIITERLPLEEWALAFKRLASGQAFKIVLKPGERP